MLTLEEVHDKYGNVPTFFQSYYKYKFYFQGVAEDGAIIKICYGGDHTDIYRFDVGRDTILTINQSCYTILRIDLEGNNVFTYDTSD